MGTTSFITECTRKHGMMDLEECHWKLNKYPAQAAGLLDRGHLAEGMPADIIVYDYENLALEPGQKFFDFPGGDWRRGCKAQGYHWSNSGQTAQTWSCNSHSSASSSIKTLICFFLS